MDSNPHPGVASDASEARLPRVVVVEDESDIAALVAYQLTRDGFRVETAGNGRDAIAAVEREIPDLMVLDRMLPGVSGDEVLRLLRADPSTMDVPVLMLTARREQEDKIEGLELGADDYLTKPFSSRELVLRARALCRRSRGSTVTPGGKILVAGPLRIDVEAHRVVIDGEDVPVAPTEFRLLQALLERRGRTQSRKQLLERAWKLEADVSERIQTRTVDMHVRRLRGKLGDVGGWIHTVRGFGYRLKVPEGVE
jgi:two-component system phosphate regulon response regulator PhoB